jgi:hypothetical protein
MREDLPPGTPEPKKVAEIRDGLDRLSAQMRRILTT